MDASSKISTTGGGTGIEGALQNFAENYATEEDRGEIRLYTSEAMTENFGIYPRLGYREYSRHVENGFSRIYFSKQFNL